MKKFIYFSCLILATGCGGGDDNPEPVPGGNVAPTDPDARETFFEETISTQPWRLSRFVFDDTTRFSVLRDSAFTDLYAKLPDCRKDDTYTWNYEFKDVRIDFYDQQQHCNPQEPTFLERGLLLDFNDSLTVASATFKNLTSVNKFLGRDLETVGTGWSFYEMEWRITVLAKDSINIRGVFTERNMPRFSAQFVPVD